MHGVMVKASSMQRLLLVLVGVTALLSICRFCAAAGSLAQTLPFSPVFTATSPIVIPVTNKAGEAALEFPAIAKQANKVLCMRFRAFLRSDKPSGWGDYLSLQLNGKMLKGELPDGTDRLLNRGPYIQNINTSMFSTVPANRPWWTGNQILPAFFGPGVGEMDPRLVSARDEGYWYLLNISDAASYLVYGFDNRIENDTPNRLVFNNNYLVLPGGETASCHEMRIEDVSVGYLSQDVVDGLQTAKNVSVPATALTGKTLTTSNCSLTVSSSGGMELRANNNRYFIDSSFSYPGAIMGFHKFSLRTQQDAGWSVQISAGKDPGVIVVKGASSKYNVIRTIKMRDGKFSIFDRIQNKTDAPLGMSIQNNAIIPQRFGLGNLRLCGNPDISSSDGCAPNPTVFVRQADSSLGIVAEDSVYRLQMELIKKANVVQFGTQHFGVPPRGEYTLEWTLYPSAEDRDYFGFVNRVREAWKVNFTIPGQFAFCDTPKHRQDLQLKIYAVLPWFLYDTGANVTHEEFRDLMKPKLAAIHADQPDAVTLGMMETNLVPVNCNKLTGASSILDPSLDDKYGVELTSAQTQVLANHRLFDSMLKTTDGRAIIDTYYSTTPFVDLLTYPAPGNSQLKYILDQIDYLMDTVGFRGIYMDQFALGLGNLTNKDRCDFSKWDGHTVDLDSRGDITRSYTDVSLVGGPARATIIKHVLKKHGVIVSNGHSTARETTGLPCVNFQETEWGAWNPALHLQEEPPVIGDMAAGHLDTPIALGIRPYRYGQEAIDHTAECINKWVITCLKNGQLYYFYTSEIPTTGPGSGEYGVLNYMFPFTPVELHSGWLVGRERIITCLSGKFFWAHPEKPECLLFDLKGARITPNVSMVARGKKGWDVTLKLADWTQVAVIMYLDKQ